MIMKRSTIGMLAVACIVCGPVFAVDGVPHAPLTSDTACVNLTPPSSWATLTTPYGASPTYTGPTATGAGSIPIFALVPNYDNPVTSWPAAGSWDFCAAFDTLSCSLGALSSFSTDVATYQNMTLCSSDLNGPPATGSTAINPLTGNGIPDGEYELGLLAAVLNNSFALDPAKNGGITNADVMTAFQGNFNYFRVTTTMALASVPLNPPPAAPSDLRSMVPGLIPWMPASLATVLAGYATQGDGNSMAALNTLLGELSALGFQSQPELMARYITSFASIFGPDGDADGDGYSNRQEYNCFHSQGAAATIAAQLNPAITPAWPVATGSIVIDGNLACTRNPQVTLALTWGGGAGTGAVRMRFSENGSTWTAWESLKATRSYTLSAPDGYKTVRVQYLDSMGNRSAAFGDFILLDAAAPTGSIIINNGASVTTSQAVTLSLNWSDESGAGATRMRFSDDGAHWTAWEPVAATRAYTLPGPNGHHTVRVQFRDGLGRVSAAYRDYINLLIP